MNKTCEAAIEQTTAKILSGKLTISVICPTCKDEIYRTIDYRIVDIVGFECENCPPFSVHVQNVFDAGAASVDRVAIVREAFEKVEEQMKGSPYWAIERDRERFRHCANAILADMESEPGLF